MFVPFTTVLLLGMMISAISLLPAPALSITANQALPQRTNHTPANISVTGAGASSNGMVQLIVNGANIPQATPTASAAGDYSVSGNSALVPEPGVNAIQVRDTVTGDITSAGNVILDITPPGLVSFTASPDPADAGPVTFTFRFTEAMKRDSNPSVRFITSGNLQTKTASANPVWSADSTSFSVTGMVNLTDAEGLATVSVSSAFDLAGNHYENNNAGSFTIDVDLTPASIYPAAPFFSNNLEASPRNSGNSYKWYRNGLIIPGQTNYLLPAAFTSSSDSIRVEVILASGDIKASPPCTVISSIPTNLTVTPAINGVLNLSWTPSPNPEVIKVLIFSDRGSGTIDFAVPIAQIPVPRTTYSISGMSDGSTQKFLLGVAAASGQSEVTAASSTQSIISAMADRFPPVVKALSPERETSLSTPKIVFSISDTSSGIDLTTILLTMDGIAVPHAFSSSEGLVYYPVPLALSQGDHSASLKIADKVGNSTSLIHFFRVTAASEILNCNLYPNPCRNLRQTIRYTLGTGAEEGTITIYDARERIVRKFENAPAFSGINEVEWDLTDEDGIALPNGTYFLEIKFIFTQGKTSRKMVKSSLIR
jgi:hypothetical protein